MAKTLVNGEIVLPGGTKDFSGAVVRVNLEGAGLLDMAAEVVAQKVLHNVSYNGGTIGFSVDGEIAADSGPYRISAHISMDGSDDIRKGDYITKRAYTVLKQGAPDTIRLEVEVV